MEAIERERLVDPVSDPARRIAPGGWRRAVVGIALGAVAGLATAAALPRDPALTRPGRARRRGTGRRG